MSQSSFSTPYRIRLATTDDLQAINVIYNHYVLRSTCTFQEVPSTEAERTTWFAGRGPEHPVTIAVDPAGTVLGWGSLSKFHARSAFRFTVENSVYIHHDHHRRGLGKALLADLLDRSAAAGHRSIVALIAGDQSSSIALHKTFGFRHAGRIVDAGFKFERWIDLVYMQRETVPPSTSTIPT